jgi:uridine kinase
VTSRHPEVDSTAERLVADLLAAAPTLGRTRLVCVDGPAGSGKTTLAAALRRAARDALRSPGEASDPEHVDVVHMDDVYEGWTGMARGMDVVSTDVVGPLREGRPGRYRRWDWHRSAYAEEHVVDPVDVLVVEGVGSGNAAYADVVTRLVWVETPPDLRLGRGLERDGEQMRELWLRWADEEQAMFAEHRTRERADVVVDGVTGQPR